jgi:CRISPR-associated protein Csm3
MMTDETAEALERSLYTDMPMTQVKTEVIIDRITSQATPRQMERVPAGAQFAYELVFNVFFESDLAFLPYVAEAMDLLENDYLGGQGSRGYGQVQFTTCQVDVVSFNGVDLAAKNEVAAFRQTVERGV